MDKVKFLITAGVFAGGFLFGRMWQERKDILVLLDLENELVKYALEKPSYTFRDLRSKVSQPDESEN